MPHYRRQGHSADEAADVIAPIAEELERFGSAVRQVLPLPRSAQGPQPHSRTAGDEAVTGLSRTLVPLAGRDAAPSIVTEAVSVLDEEMAKGVLAARDAGAPPGRRADAGTVLRQLHDAVDGLARLFPELHGRPNPQTTSVASATDTAVPHVKPTSATRAGQRATIRMTLCNREQFAVRLIPTTTDLVGSSGQRLSHDLIAFTPPEVQLEPGASIDVQGQFAIPVGTAPGVYAGLLVVTGIDYLRSLVTIEVM